MDIHIAPSLTPYRNNNNNNKARQVCAFPLCDRCWLCPRSFITAVVLGPSCTKPHGDRRRAGQWRRRSARWTTPLRDRSDLLRRERPALLPEVAGPQAAATVGYVAAEAPLLTVVPVSDDRIDDAARFAGG